MAQRQCCSSACTYHFSCSCTRWRGGASENGQRWRSRCRRREKSRGKKLYACLISTKTQRIEACAVRDRQRGAEARNAHFRGLDTEKTEPSRPRQRPRLAWPHERPGSAAAAFQLKPGRRSRGAAQAAGPPRAVAGASLSGSWLRLSAAAHARSQAQAAPLRPERRLQQRRCGSSAFRRVDGVADANAEWLSPDTRSRAARRGAACGRRTEIRRQAAVEVRRRVAARAPRRLTGDGGASAHSLRQARCISDSRACFCRCAAAARRCMPPQRRATHAAWRGSLSSAEARTEARFTGAREATRTPAAKVEAWAIILLGGSVGLRVAGGTRPGPGGARASAGADAAYTAPSKSE